MYTTLLVFDDCLLVEQIPASETHSAATWKPLSPTWANLASLAAA